MKRRLKNAPPASTPAVREGSKGPGLRFIVSALALAVITTLGIWWGFRQTGARPAAAVALRTSQADWQEAVRLGKEKQFRESLELFERAAPAIDGRNWVFHHDYSSTLNNVTMQVDDVDGIPVPAVRTSIERVRLVRRSLEEIERADQLTRTSEQRSIVHRAWGQTFQVWGFPWEALSELQMARSLDSANRNFSISSDAYLYRMQNPVRSKP